MSGRKHSAPSRAQRGRMVKASRAQRGLSIIELMVGIVVALFVSLAATGSAVMFTSSQRQGIGTGGAIVNASTALTAIKSDAALAGLGFFGGSASLCTNLNLSVGATVLSDGAVFSPLQVLNAPDMDRLDVVYATVIESGTNVQLQSASDASTAELTSLLPAAVGQVVMLAPESPGDPCTVRTITTVTASTATTAQTVTFGNTGSYNTGAFTISPAYASRARVSLLGELRWNRYRVSGGNLIMERPLDGTSAILVRDVMAFRVQYGISVSSASTTLDDWVDATGAWATLTAANINRVRALRIGVMVRSPQLERKDTGGVCRATDTAPQLFGTVPANLTTGVDWNCYRYRSTTSVVPLRNFVL